MGIAAETQGSPPRTAGAVPIRATGTGPGPSFIASRITNFGHVCRLATEKIGFRPHPPRGGSRGVLYVLGNGVGAKFRGRSRLEII